jgi:hypothetical protein
MEKWERYEILLPLRFNDGTVVPKVLLAETIQELESRFGAVSSETQIIHGRWHCGATAYRDDLMRVWVDVEQTPTIQAFFTDFKVRAKARFQQLDIWLTSHSITVI